MADLPTFPSLYRKYAKTYIFFPKRSGMPRFPSQWAIANTQIPPQERGILSWLKWFFLKSGDLYTYSLKTKIVDTGFKLINATTKIKKMKKFQKMHSAYQSWRTTRPSSQLKHWQCCRWGILYQPGCASWPHFMSLHCALNHKHNSSVVHLNFNLSIFSLFIVCQCCENQYLLWYVLLVVFNVWLCRYVVTWNNFFFVVVFCFFVNSCFVCDSKLSQQNNASLHFQFACRFYDLLL